MSEIGFVLAWGAGVLLASGLGYHAGRHAVHTCWRPLRRSDEAIRRRWVERLKAVRKRFSLTYSPTTLRYDGYTDVDNRELDMVPLSVPQRATILSTSYPSLRVQDLTRFEFERLASYTEVFRAPHGTVIFHEATPARWMALVVAGEVDILKLDAGQRNRRLATLGPSQLVGEMAFLDSQTRSATAVATKETRLLVVTRSAFDRLVADHPALLAKLIPGLIRELTRRLRRTNLKLVDCLTD